MNKIKSLLSPFCKMKHGIRTKGRVYVGKCTIIRSPKNFKCGDNINISPHNLLVCGGKLELKDNVYLGYFSEVMCIYSVTFEKNVICGPYLFITDSNHEYRDISKPISEQGAPLSEKNNKIVIGEDSWIGAHVTICGNVKIGKHVVVAAGSVVTKDVPDYSVVAGVPARIIKRYDFNLGDWVKI